MDEELKDKTKKRGRPRGPGPKRKKSIRKDLNALFDKIWNDTRDLEQFNYEVRCHDERKKYNERSYLIYLCVWRKENGLKAEPGRPKKS